MELQKSSNFDDQAKKIARLVVQMGTCDGDRAAAAALRLVDDVAGNKFFLTILYHHTRANDCFFSLISFEICQLLYNRDRREHGLSQRIQLERRNGSCIAHTA